MARAARDLTLSRRSWLLAGLGAVVSRAARAGSDPSLEVSWDGDNLHVQALRLHFLTGKPLARLKDGMTVVYLSQLTLFTDDYRSALRRVPARFAVSYDLWEEKFKIARLDSSEPAVSHLSTSSAESWLLDNMFISSSGLVPDRPFWLRFELRAADPREDPVVGESGINLTRLIEIFSRQPRSQQPSWLLNGGPFRLADLKRVLGRTARIG